MSSKKWLLVFALLAILFTAGGDAFASTEQGGEKAKYVFLFIGDGMAIAQRNAAELYLAKEKGLSRPEKARLVMNTLPAQGMNTTYDLTSVIPDSASTATAISCGYKTKSGVIGMDAEAKVSYENIAERARKDELEGWNPFHRITGPRNARRVLRPRSEPKTRCTTFRFNLRIPVSITLPEGSCWSRRTRKTRASQMPLRQPKRTATPWPWVVLVMRAQGGSKQSHRHERNSLIGMPRCITPSTRATAKTR